ncbi:hypothetical protein [Pelomicrobium sp.]|jgi:hypothetical protein|uniref:hypothetical protein n=1 Tax=Pelomicrobium sp. TaxID=2815319 RepID=UPI002FDD930E
MDFARLIELGQQLAARAPSDWPLFLALAAVIGLVIGSHVQLRRHFRREVDALAPREDFYRLVDEQRQVNEALARLAARLEAAPSLPQDSDMALKRGKLEELMSAVYELLFWLDREKSVRLFNAPARTEEPPVKKVMALARLYFPELAGAVSTLYAVYSRVMIGLLRCELSLAQVQGDEQRRREILGEWQKQYLALLAELSEATRTVEAGCAMLAGAAPPPAAWDRAGAKPVMEPPVQGR